MLKKNLKNSERQRASNLKQLISGHQGWIEEWFKNKRDTLTHYKALESSGFVNIPHKGGSVSFRSPAVDGTPLSEIVDLLYKNLER